MLICQVWKIFQAANDVNVLRVKKIIDQDFKKMTVGEIASSVKLIERIV